MRLSGLNGTVANRTANESIYHEDEISSEQQTKVFTMKMKSVPAKTFGAVLAIAALAVGWPAHAVIVNYSAGGWTQQFPSSIPVPDNAPWGPNGYPGDTVTLQAFTGSLDLTPGTYIQKINTLLWSIDYTYGGTPEPWPDINMSFDAPRTMSFVGGSDGSLANTGLLRVNYWNDYLSLDAGSTVSFIVQGYKVDVTPLGLAEVGGSDFDGGNPWAQPNRDVMARFDVTAVPEPTTMIAGALLLLPFGASTLRMLRKRQAA
jgi:hypothetical protein